MHSEIVIAFLLLLWVYTLIALVVVIHLLLMAFFALVFWLQASLSLVSPAVCLSTKPVLSLTHLIQILVCRATVANGIFFLFKNFFLLGALMLVLVAINYSFSFTPSLDYFKIVVVKFVLKIVDVGILSEKYCIKALKLFLK